MNNTKTTLLACTIYYYINIHPKVDAIQDASKNILTEILQSTLKQIPHTKKVILAYSIYYYMHVYPGVKGIQNTSKHMIKEIFQRVSEHLPYLQLYELRRSKTLLSGLPINNRPQKIGRVLQTIPQTGSIYSLLFDGKQIVVQAKENILYIFHEHQLPDYISKEIGLAMFRIILGSGIYYGLTKPGDARVYKGKFSKNNHSSPDQDQSLPLHDTEE